MKKLFIYFAIIITGFCFFTQEITFADCSYNWANTLSGNLDSCFKSGETSAVKVNDATIETGFKSMIANWVENIALILWLLSVGSLIYGALSMTLSTWDDEKIKKSKDIVKWSIIWFIAILSASTIVSLVINFMYKIWENI